MVTVLLFNHTKFFHVIMILQYLQEFLYSETSYTLHIICNSICNKSCRNTWNTCTSIICSITLTQSRAQSLGWYSSVVHKIDVSAISYLQLHVNWLLRVQDENTTKWMNETTLRDNEALWIFVNMNRQTHKFWCILQLEQIPNY